MKHTAKGLFSVLLVLCLVLSLTVFTVGAEDKTLTSVYASWAAEGHTNEPLADADYTVEGDSVTIGIMTTTDMHGRAYDWNSYTNSSLSNNFLQAAKLIADRRALVDDSIVIDNGDILQGSALSSYNLMKETGKNSPIAIALRYIGYDAFGLGNHEFNFSPEQQWNFYNMLESTDSSLPGTPVSILCANVIETETKESVFSPYKTFTYKFSDGTTYTIGLLMLENMNNANWDVASHYEGCTFGHPDNEAHSYVYEYERYAKELEEKCDYVIVAAHSGEGSATTFNQENQGAYLIANTTGIDMLITGHNHQANAGTLKNKDGEDVLVMNGGGSVLAETVLTLTKGADGKVTVTNTAPARYSLSNALTDEAGKPIRVPSADYVSGNEAYDGLKALLKEHFEKADAFVNAEIGTVSGDWDNKNSYYVEQSDSYDLVHRAQIWAACTDNNIDPTKERVVSMTSPVANWNWKVADLFTEEGQKSASISLRDCYSLYRYDNNTLFMIKITGEKLMNWMQKTVQNYKVNTDGTIGGGGFGCDQFYGINYDVYMGNAAGRQVENVTYADGTPVKADDEIYLCLSSYRLSANADADAYGWFGATGITSNSEEVLWDATVSERFNTVGGSCPLIIGEYIKALTAEGKEVTPEEPETTWKVHAEASPVKTLEVFETTDIHGYLLDTSSGDEATFQYRMAYIANVVKAARANNDDVILLDGGDIYQGTPVSNLTYGNAIRAAMDKMGYDAVSLGNHEFDWDVTTYAADKDGTMPAYEIGAFKGDSDIPVLAYDLIDNATGTKASFVQEYTVLDKAGVSVAVIGYIPDYSMDIMAAKINPFTILEDLDRLNAKIDEVIEKEKPDVVMVLAHASPSYLAQAVDAEKVDLVMGGHSHQATFGKSKNGVAYMQGNCQAQGYANTKIRVNTVTGEVTVDTPTYVRINGDKNALYDTEENADKLDAEIVAISKASWDAVKDQMSEVLGSVDQSIYRRQNIGKSTNTIAGNWLTGIMLRATAEQNTVVAFTNSGGIRCDLLMEEGAEKRDITVGDIYTISPFGNRWYVYDITGAELAKTVENSFGNANYGDQFSGMTVKYIIDGEDTPPTEPGGWPHMAPRKVVSIVLDDGTVVDVTDTTKTYRVVTNEYCATLPGSVFENKTPVVDVNEAPVDNDAIISVLRAEGKANGGKLALDLTERCLELNENVVDFEFLVTSDLHGKIFATDYSSGVDKSGTYRQGLTRVATYIKEQRAAYGENVFVADLGDSIQGEPLTYYWAFNGEKLDKDDPTIKAFRTIGYDLWVLGNHEFNYGMNILGRQMDYATSASTETEKKLDIGVANYLDAATNSTSSKSWDTYGDIVPYVIKDFDGVKVAVIGLGTPNIPNWDGPANWEGFYFESIYETYKHYEAEMLEKADMIVVLSHCGLGSEMPDESYDSLTYLVQNTNSIDFIVSGHAHGRAIAEVENKDGEKIKVLQAGTKAAILSQVKVSYDKETGKADITAENVNMSDYALDEELVTVLKPYEEYVWTNYMLQKIGEASDNFSAANLGTAPSAFVDLVNKVQLWGAYDSTGLNTPDDKTDDTPAMLSITAPLTSGSKENLIPKGDIFLGDLFALYRYENWFYQLTMSGKEVRTWLEYSASKLMIREDGTVDVMGGLTYYDVIGGEGFSYILDPTKPEGSRVVSMTYNGKEVADDFEFTIVMNNYRFTGGGNYVKYCNEHGCDLSDLEDRIIYSTQYDMIQGEDLGQARALIQAYIEQEKVIDPEITSTWSIQKGYNPFSDVSEDAWYYEYVMAAAEDGLVNGYEDGTFQPEGNLTRAEATMLLYRAAGSPEVEGKASYTDLPNAWYQDAIAWAEQNKVVNGVGKGKFEPEESVTREQLVTMIWRLEGQKKVEKTLEGYEDSAKVNSWAVDAFAWAIEEGIINGTTFTGKTGIYLAPQDDITRAEAAKVLVVYNEK